MSIKASVTSNVNTTNLASNNRTLSERGTMTRHRFHWDSPVNKAIANPITYSVPIRSIDLFQIPIDVSVQWITEGGRLSVGAISANTSRINGITTPPIGHIRSASAAITR